MSLNSLFPNKPSHPGWARTSSSAQIIASIQTGGIELIDAIAQEWMALCAEGSHDQPLFRPEWVRAHCHVFGTGRQLVLVTARKAGRLRGVLPLISAVEPFRGIPVRKLRQAANGHSGRFDIVAAPGAEGAAAARAIWDSVRTIPDWDVVEIGSVPVNGATETLAWAARSSGFLTGRIHSADVPYILIESSSADTGCVPLATSFLHRSAFRSDYRQRLRKAQQRYTVTLKRFDEADSAALETFFRLEACGWKGQQGSAIMSHPTTYQYYKEIAANAARLGYFGLYLLMFNSTPVAGLLGLHYGNRYYAPKIAYDEKFRYFAPGHMLMGTTLQDLAQRGVCEFDLLGPMTRWQREWTSLSRPHFTHYIFQRSVLGYALCSSEFRVVPQLRKIRAFWRTLRKGRSRPS